MQVLLRTSHCAHAKCLERLNIPFLHTFVHYTWKRNASARVLAQALASLKFHRDIDGCVSAA
jgi:hypothetical protein